MLRQSDAGPQARGTLGLVAGMRRVDWVRIVLADGDARCEAVGIGHRLPTVRSVSLDTAVALAAGGVPSVIRREDPRARPATPVGERC